VQRKWKRNSFWNLNWSFFKEGRSCSSETLLIGMKLSDGSKGWEIYWKEKVGTVFKGFHKTIINFYLTVNNVFALKVATSLHFLRKNSPSNEYLINHVVKIKRAGTALKFQKAVKIEIKKLTGWEENQYCSAASDSRQRESISELTFSTRI